MSALVFALVLRYFERREGRNYLRFWILSWLAFALYATGSMAGRILGLSLPAGAPVRLIISAVSLAAAYLQMVWLLLGSYEFTRRTRLRGPWELPTMAAALVIGVMLTLLWVNDPTAADRRYFVRVGLRAIAVGLSFIAAAIWTLKERGPRRGLASALLPSALFVYGLDQTAGFYLAQPVMGSGGRGLVPISLGFGYFDIFVQLLIGLGMLLWMLEQSRAERRIDWQRLADSEERLRGIHESGRVVERYVMITAGDFSEFGLWAALLHLGIDFRSDATAQRPLDEQRRDADALPVGHAIDARAGAVHVAVELVPPRALGGLAAALGSKVTDEFRRCSAALRHQAVARNQSFARRVRNGLALPATLQRCDVRCAHAQRRIDNDQLRHAPRMSGRIHERDHAAHRMADQDEIAQCQLFDRLGQVCRETFIGVIKRRGRPVTVAVAALVERVHVIIGAQVLGYEIEPVRVRCAAVHAQHGSAARAAVIEVA